MGVVRDSSAAGGPTDPTWIEPPKEKVPNVNLDLVRSLRMHRYLAVAAGIVTTALLVVFGLTREPYYEASSLIYVQPIVPKVATDATTGSYDSSRYDSYIQDQLLAFHRPDILGHTLDQLPPSIRATLSPDKAKAIKQIQSGLAVERLPGGYQIEVTMGGSDPATVAPIANAVTAAYLENGQQDDLALSDQQLASLIQERQRIQDELDKDRKEQADLSVALGVSDTAGENANPYDNQLGDLRTQLAAARNAHAVAEAQLASVANKPQSSALDSAADSLTRSDAELSAMKGALGQRRSTLITEMSGLTPQNPQYGQDQKELDDLTQTINSLTKEVSHKSGQSLQGELRLEVARTGDIQARLEAALARETAAATTGTPQLQRAQDLAEAIKLLQARFAEVDNAAHSIPLGRGSSFAAHVSLMATQPTAPKPSRKIAILALALPVGVFFGIGAAVAGQKLDSRVYIGEDVYRVLDFSPMAVLPDPGDVEPRVAEEFLFRLVAGLDQAHRVGGANTFIFTACSQEATNDELVSSVAAELESLGYSTMTLSAAETLSPVELIGRSPAMERRDTTELARSDSMTGMRVRRESLIDEKLERLKRKVDFLFIKAQPLRFSSEAEFVVRLGDVTVLVVESGEITRKELRSCLSTVGRLKARGLAAVVTGLKLCNADSEFIESVRFAGERRSSDRLAKVPDGMTPIGRT
jgi:uncharacterized protein involved in exopolysaccharide biosynthesis